LPAVFQDHSAGAEDSAVAFISYSSNFILARLAYLEIHEMQLATPLPASNSTK
jgi:hypothetical protein